MKVNVDKLILDKLLRASSFQLNGDINEKRFGQYVVSRFPNCELFWKLFVVPLTERLSGYPQLLTDNIRPRKGVAVDLENIANINYSIFLNIVYAHIHLQVNLPCSLENFYVHLASVCDLAETFLEKWFFLILKCRGDECVILQKITREEFLSLAGTWYDGNYLTLYENYFSKGKILPIRIPSRKDIIKELFERYLMNEDLRKEYIKFSQCIKEYRNVIVHDVQVGSLSIGGTMFVPKPQVIKKYKTWRQVFAVKDRSTIMNDFRPKEEQMEADITHLEIILNKIWDLIIKEFSSEFYRRDRLILRDMYGFVLLDE